MEDQPPSSRKNSRDQGERAEVSPNANYQARLPSLPSPPLAYPLSMENLTVFEVLPNPFDVMTYGTARSADDLLATVAKQVGFLTSSPGCFLIPLPLESPGYLRRGGSQARCRQEERRHPRHQGSSHALQVQGRSQGADGVH